MLNKELLLLGSKSSAPYTHIITVGFAPAENVSTNLYGYSLFLESSFTDKGDLEPKYYNSPYSGQIEIQELVTYRTSRMPCYIRLVVDGFLGEAKELYFGRSDSRISWGLPVEDQTDETTGTVIWRGAQLKPTVYLFNDSDIGKEIPIWLSTTPPHIKIKVQEGSSDSSSNSSNFRRVA